MTTKTKDKSFYLAESSEVERFFSLSCPVPILPSLTAGNAPAAGEKSSAIMTVSSFQDKKQALLLIHLQNNKEAAISSLYIMTSYITTRCSLHNDRMMYEQDDLLKAHVLAERRGFFSDNVRRYRAIRCRGTA